MDSDQTTGPAASKGTRTNIALGVLNIALLAIGIDQSRQALEMQAEVHKRKMDTPSVRADLLFGNSIEPDANGLLWGMTTVSIVNSSQVQSSGEVFVDVLPLSSAPEIECTLPYEIAPGFEGSTRIVIKSIPANTTQSLKVSDRVSSFRRTKQKRGFEYDYCPLIQRIQYDGGEVDIDRPWVSDDGVDDGVENLHRYADDNEDCWPDGVFRLKLFGSTSVPVGHSVATVIQDECSAG